MSKEQPYKSGNFRIVIEPDRPVYGTPTELQWQQQCRGIVDEIKRHVDGFDRVSIESDALCRYCDSEWETQPDDSIPHIPKGQPLCCDDAIEHWERGQQ